MVQPVYLDYASTTPVDPEVARVMTACLTLEGNFANPASRTHVYGWQAEEAVELARGQVAKLLHADAREIVWTSGATESNNLALKGVFERTKYQGHLIVSAIEHKAVLDPAAWLQEQGVEVTYLQPDKCGKISAEQVANALRDNTLLVSIMLVNNELGTINPIAEIAKVCREHTCLLHVDAAQAVGKMPVDVKQLDVDLLSVSAHKMYGPKGIGALYVRRSGEVNVAAQIHGGGHERGMRSGTLATHQCAGFGCAAALALDNMSVSATKILRLRNALWQGIASLPGVHLNGDLSQSIEGHLNVTFVGIEGEVLLLSLREIAVSSGSACTSATMSPSYVLKAIGLNDADALSSIRFSLGRYTTDADIEHAIAHVCRVVTQSYERKTKQL